MMLYDYLRKKEISYIYKSALADLYLYLYVDVNPRSHHMTWETKLFFKDDKDDSESSFQFDLFSIGSIVENN